MEARYISIRETADRMGVSDRTVRRWIARGILRAARLGRTIRIDSGELDRLPDAAAPRSTLEGAQERPAAYASLSEEVLWRTWNNPGDAVYDDWREIYGVRQGRRGAAPVSVSRQHARKGAARRRG